ncbi:hypothetical protein TELCIR_20015, partial [Teladorsagia circumcincta]
FNLGIGGPTPAPTVTALLVCRADQQWYYTDGTTSLLLENNGQGCKQMNAICRSGSETDDAFMEFNGGVGGPPGAPTVTARLTCRADQKWYYTDGTTSL